MLSVRTRGALAVALGVTVALTAAACGGGDDNKSGSGSGAGKAVTLTWWHNASTDPGKTVWQQVADAYHTSHPNVSFKVQPIQNEQIKTKIPVALQSSDPPDIFQQWGSGAQATQVQSGKLMDMSSQVSGWIGELGDPAKGWQTDGKWYGVPYGLHTVGFWYRKDLFQRAGITAPPTTMDEFNQAVSKLKAAGITPVAIGSKDKWPDAFWWEYFVLRECTPETVQKAMTDMKTEDPCFVKAGQDLKALIDTKPFQNGFLGTPAQQGAGSSAGLVANGKAAMELMGDWNAVVMPPLTQDKAIASKLSWFAFPAVTGGQGDPTATLGGGDGFSCSVKAGDDCPDFLKYVTSVDVQKKLVETQTISLPVNPGANSAVKDEAVKETLKASQASKFAQTYFDQALPTSVGNALNDAIANFFAGQGSPEEIAKAVGTAAKNL